MNQKEIVYLNSLEVLDRFTVEPNFLHILVIGDESLAFEDDPETKG